MENNAFLDPSAVSLMEECIYFGGMTLAYQLLRSMRAEEGKYLIRVRQGTESYTGEIHGDLSRAIECYRSAVRGAVTPFSLESAVKHF